MKLQQSFFYSWADDVDGGSGRTSIWVDGSVHISFTYETNQRYRVNRAWLEALMASANSPGGMRLMVEPESLGATEETDRPDEIAA